MSCKYRAKILFNREVRLTLYVNCVLVETSNVNQNFPFIQFLTKLSWNLTFIYRADACHALISSPILRKTFIFSYWMNLASWQHLFQSKNFWQFCRNLAEPKDFQTILLHRLQFLIGQAEKTVWSTINKINLKDSHFQILTVTHFIVCFVFDLIKSQLRTLFKPSNQKFICKNVYSACKSEQYWHKVMFGDQAESISIHNVPVLSPVFSCNYQLSKKFTKRLVFIHRKEKLTFFLLLFYLI